MRAPYECHGAAYAHPDALQAAARLVDDEWGGHGYVMGIARGDGTVAIFEVVHFDGSRFNIVADKYGNARPVSEDADAARVEVDEFTANARRT
jgi:hypothetical protein